jgi:hypothetical protein
LRRQRGEAGMLLGFWQWLHDTSPGQATFLCSLIAFLALLGGALFNAWLNRAVMTGSDERISARSLLR